ncbi:MAG: hypothetical protein ACK50A_00735 [Sphingobacteriaceae bacterium]
MKRSIILMFLVGFILFSCKKSETNASSTNSGYTPTCTSTKSFSADVLPLINASCNTSGCHNNYSTYAQISAGKTSIRSRVLNGSMPKNSTLSNAQKDIIICWIDAGAPNN